MEGGNFEPPNDPLPNAYVICSTKVAATQLVPSRCTREHLVIQDVGFSLMQAESTASPWTVATVTVLAVRNSVSAPNVAYCEQMAELERVTNSRGRTPQGLWRYTRKLLCTAHT